MNIFVAKLDYSIDESFLQDLFEEYGEVSSAKVIMDKFTSKSKGFGFVEMPNSSEGQAAIDALDGREFQGRSIVVKVANPRSDSNRGGGGGGGGFNRGRY